jgi:hypothetical protein
MASRGIPAREEGLTAFLDEAAGFAVLDLQRRRIGMVVGVVDDPESVEHRLAVRRTGIFARRRRLLPLDAVETVDAARRIIVVDAQRAAHEERVDADAGAGAEAAEATSRSAAEPSLVSRVEFYTRASHSESEQRDRVVDEAESISPWPPTTLEEHHLRLVSAPAGYQLSARPGEPPAVGTRISGTEIPEPLVVVKVGPSPLPGDPRPCAFLERDNHVASPQSS